MISNFVISNFRFSDILDIIFLSVLAYHLYLWFQGTKALKSLVGLLILGLVYALARSWGLFLTTWIFEAFWQVLIILLIILFQSEIRQVLERVNPFEAIGLRKISLPEKWIVEISKAVFDLASQKIGSLIIIERFDHVDELITGGIELEGDPTSEILMSVFHKESPLHDGAMLIRKGRIKKVGTFLPLSSEKGLPKEWGTRHRAAKGLSERCDALVIAVSEERGKVSISRAGRMSTIGNSEAFSRFMKDAFIRQERTKKNWREVVGSFLFKRWNVKLATVFFVSFLWITLAGQQDFEVSFQVPLEIKNLPNHLEIVEPLQPKIQVTVQGLRKNVSVLNEKDISAQVNLSEARIGQRKIQITRDQIKLSNEQIKIIRITPTDFIFIFQEKS